VQKKLYKKYNILFFFSDQEYYKMSSIGEQKFQSFAKSDGALFAEYNKKFLTRTYPAGSRVHSSNYNPMTAWVVGCHFGKNKKLVCFIVL